MEQEIWKDIVGYEGIYRISNFGNAIVLDRFCNSRYGNKVIRKSKKMKPILINKYYSIPLTKKGYTVCKRIHRLVLEAFSPNTENKPQINHIDGNKLNNNLTNLEWCTAKENMKHAFSNNLIKIAHGEHHCCAKFI